MTLFSNYWTLASFSLTILSAPYWPWMPGWGVALLCLALCFAALTLPQWTGRLRGVGGIAFAVLVIITHAQLVRSQSNTIFQAGQDITIKGEVDSFFKQITYGYEGSVVVRSINGQALPEYQYPTIRLISPVLLYPGDDFEFSVTVKPVFGRLNQVGFDLESFYLSQGWVARATVQRASSFRIVSNASWRSELYQQVREWMEHSQAKGLVLALTFGERDLISDQQWLSLRDSGLIHLVAISGLHIGMAFGIGYLLGLPLMRIHRHLLWSPMLLGACLALGYAWLAGFTIPTQRALIMCWLNVALTLSRVTITAPQRLLLTLAVVLLLAPFSSLSRSFWLSFLAVGIVLYHVCDAASQRPWWKKLLYSQFSLTLLMLPVSAFFFAGFSLSSALYNLVFIPWFTLVIVPGLFIALLLSQILPDSVWIWDWVGISFIPLDYALDWVGPSWVSVSQTSSLLLLTGLVLWAIREVISRRLLLAIGALFATHWFSIPHKDGWRVEVLDVGHGLAVMIERHGHYLLYDTARSWPGGSFARSLIEPLLVYWQARKLDGVIISHTDNDHAGGLADVIERLQPGWIIASQQHPDWLACTKGQRWHWQGLELTALWPPAQVSRADNLHSCVIRIEDKTFGHSLLLSGDVTAVGEWLLSREPSVVKSDVMIVPHHGSQTSSSSGLIERVQPKIAIASLAKGNQWNLPHPRVVARYQAAGAQWIDTGASGQVSLIYRAQTRHLSTMRQSTASTWYRQMLRKEVE